MPVDLPIDPIRYLPESNDDAQWKRDVDRFAREVAARFVAMQSEIDYLRGRVN